MIRYLEFLLTRLLGTGVDTLVLWLCSDYLLTSYWGSYLLSPVISFEFAVMNNFLWSYYWIWKNRTSHKGFVSFLHRFFIFNLSSMAGFLVKMFFLLFFEWIFGWDVVWCNLLALFISGVFNYFLTDIWVFRRHKYIPEQKS